MPEPARPGFDLEDCTFGSSLLELEDFIHAIRHEPRTRSLLRWATGLGAVSGAGGVWLASGPKTTAGLALLGFAVMCFAAHQAPEHIAQRWFAKTPRPARSLRYTVNSRELIVTSDVSHSAYGWPSIVGFHEAPNSLLIWVSSQLFLIVPKRAFPGAALSRVLAELERQEIGAPPAVPRFWSWLVVTTLLGGAALLLWNHLAPR